MKRKVLTLAALAACVTATVSASTIYGASGTELYTIVPTTGVTAAVGTGFGLGGGVTMSDIAEYDGKMYGVSTEGNLYSISLTSGTASLLGSTGLAADTLTALTFSASGTLYAAGLDTKNLYTLSTTNGAVTSVTSGTTNPDYNAAGDLEFIGGVLYMIVGGDTGGASSLVTVNLTTGALSAAHAIDVGRTAQDDVFGLAELNGILYGFTEGGEVLSINPSTGAATDVHTYSPDFYGTTDDPFVGTPEPGTLGVMMLGLASLAGIAYRRRKA